MFIHLFNNWKLCHFFQNMRRKQTSKISQVFTSKHKINESNAKVYPHIIELFDFTLNILAFMFLFPIIFLISSGTCSAPKLIAINHFTFFYKIKPSNVCQHLHIHQGLLHKRHPLFFRQIISRINTIKCRFILIILLYFKIC